MPLFADILLAALALVSPKDGETVATLRPDHAAYLKGDRAARVAVLDDPIARKRLVRAGYVQAPLRLVWTNAALFATVELSCVESGVKDAFAVTNGASFAYITNLEIGRTYRWRVSAGGESAESVFKTDPQPPRLLRVEGVINVRDLGGWTGLNGRRVRQGRIFRTAGLRGSATKLDDSIFATRYEPGGQAVTEAGLATLRDELKIRTDIELRSPQETVFLQNSLLGPNVTWIKEPFSAYNFIDNLVRGREPFIRLFKAFLDERNYPIVFHCSGGRDRTGTLAFLLLGLLGVSEEDCCRDWEASAFTEDSAEFGSGRIDRLLTYLQSQGGATAAERCERYAKSCGITDREIAAFRKLMLEEEGSK